MTGNNFTFIGRLVKEPELNTVGDNNRAVCNFALASKIRGANQTEASIFPEFVAWGSIAERIGKYLTKGSQVCVDAHYTEQFWEDTNGNKRKSIKFVVDGMQFLSRPNESPSDTNNGNVSNTRSDSEYVNEISDDELPF